MSMNRVCFHEAEGKTIKRFYIEWEEGWFGRIQGYICFEFTDGEKARVKFER